MKGSERESVRECEGRMRGGRRGREESEGREGRRGTAA